MTSSEDTSSQSKLRVAIPNKSSVIYLYLPTEQEETKKGHDSNTDSKSGAVLLEERGFVGLALARIAVEGVSHLTGAGVGGSIVFGVRSR